MRKSAASIASERADRAEPELRFDGKDWWRSATRPRLNDGVRCSPPRVRLNERAPHAHQHSNTVVGPDADPLLQVARPGASFSPTLARLSARRS